MPSTTSGVEVAAGLARRAPDLLQVGRAVGQRRRTAARPRYAASAMQRADALELGPKPLELGGRETVPSDRRGEAPFRVQPDRQGLLPATAPWLCHRGRGMLAAASLRRCGQADATACADRRPRAMVRARVEIPKLAPDVGDAARPPGAAAGARRRASRSRTAASTSSTPATSAISRRRRALGDALVRRAQRRRLGPAAQGRWTTDPARSRSAPRCWRRSRRSIT